MIDQASETVEMGQTVQAAQAQARAVMKAAEEAARPKALDAFYVGLEHGVVVQCEMGRKAFARSVAGLQLAHDALAGGGNPAGKTFKDWCVAAGISYNTAKSALRREQRKQEAHEQKQAGEGATHPCSLVVKVEDDTEKASLKAHLREVLDALRVEGDDWAMAISHLYLCWFEQGKKAAA